MSISERTLEEDEAKIDNLLHKILECNSRIEELTKAVRAKSDDGFVLERLRMITILTETVTHLATLADEIDINDERLVEQLEKNVRGELQVAIEKIKHANELLGVREA